MTAPSSIKSLGPECREMIQAISMREKPFLAATCQISSKFTYSYVLCKSWTLPAAQKFAPLYADSALKAVIQTQSAAPFVLPAQEYSRSLRCFHAWA